MSRTILYQTVEDRDNADFVEQYGPFVCRRPDAWLGEGAYFWEKHIENAHFWGRKSYGTGKYIICQSSYESTAEDYFNLYGNTEHAETLEKCKRLLETRLPKNEIVLRKVIGFMVKTNIFHYKAIRIASHFYEKIYVTRNEYMLLPQLVQLCVIDNSFLIDGEYKIVFPEEYVQGTTV